MHVTLPATLRREGEPKPRRGLRLEGEEKDDDDVVDEAYPCRARGGHVFAAKPLYHADDGAWVWRTERVGDVYVVQYKSRTSTWVNEGRKKKKNIFILLMF